MVCKEPEIRAVIDRILEHNPDLEIYKGNGVLTRTATLEFKILKERNVHTINGYLSAINSFDEHALPDDCKEYLTCIAFARKGKLNPRKKVESKKIYAGNYYDDPFSVMEY